MKQSESETITATQAHDCDVIQPLLKAMYIEFAELSRKKPQDAVSKSKVKVVNRVLNSALTILEKEPSREFLDLLNDDDLPQNSDVVLMLGQAQTALASFRKKYQSSHGGWIIEGEEYDNEEDLEEFEEEA